MAPSAFISRLLDMMTEVVAALLTRELAPTLPELAGLRMWLEDLEHIPSARQRASVLLAHLQVIQRDTEREQQNREAEIESKKTKIAHLEFERHAHD